MKNDITLKGKKLLLLGDNLSTPEIIKYAQKCGVYVIVTDNLSPDISTSKKIANEYWMFNTADVETLIKEIETKNIDGIFAGVSEFNLERAIILCNKLNLPFYSTVEQWEIASNKKNFKRFCEKNGIPVAIEYKIDTDYKEKNLKSINYPVVVKPIDCGSCVGVYICNDLMELKWAYENSIKHYRRESILVEEFIEGEEISVHYTLKNGKISFSCMMDKYLNNYIGKIPIPEGYIYPSKYLNRYTEEQNKKIMSVFHDNGWKNGVLFLQGKVNDKGFTFFEMGYRLSGTAVYKFIYALNKINSMEMLVNYSLTGKMSGYDIKLDNPFFNKYCCNLSIFVKAGIIKKIRGIERINKLKSIISVFQNYKEGDKVNYTGTLHQILFRFFIIESDLKKLKKTIDKIYSSIQVLNYKDEDMLYRFSDDRDRYFKDRMEKG